MTDLHAETARLLALRKGTTPGPWDDNVNSTLRITGPGGNTIADCRYKNGNFDARLIAAAPDMLDAIAALKAEVARLVARAEAAEAEVGRDDNLIFDAYKALLVLHRILDKTGLSAGTRAAQQIADRIVAAHPEVVARAALAEIGGGNGNS